MSRTLANLLKMQFLLAAATSLVVMTTAPASTGAAATGDEANDETQGSEEQAEEASDDEEESDDDADGSNGGSGRVAGTTFERGFNNLLERFGNNARRVAEHLYRQDYKHRENLRLARGEVDQLKQSMPKNGARLLDKTAARDFDAYRKLGKPADLQAKLQSADTTAARLREREKDDVLREVAEVTNWNFKALKGAASDLSYAVKEVEENGRKLKKAYVVQTGENGNAAETEATDWFSKNKDFLLPALTAGANGNGHATYGQQFIQQPVHQGRSNGAQQPVSAAATVLSRYDEPKKP
jgi:hypothetical protein